MHYHCIANERFFTTEDEIIKKYMNENQNKNCNEHP